MEKTKCTNGHEMLETREIEGKRSTTLKLFSRVLCRFKDCLTLQQWAFLSSLILLTYNAAIASLFIISIASGMERKHTLENMIAEEASDSNKKTMQTVLNSLNRLLAMHIPYACCMGIVSVSNCVLIYGVLSKSKWHIFQWIVTSILINVVLFILTITVFSEPGVFHYVAQNTTTHPSDDSNDFPSLDNIACKLMFLSVLTASWLVIFYYHDLLKRTEKQQKAQVSKNRDLKGQQIQMV